MGFLKYSFTVCGLILGIALPAHAAYVDLAWDPNSEPELSGYQVLWGTQQGVYPNSKFVNTITAARVSNLQPGNTYYFVVRAISNTGSASDFSNEVFQTIVSLPANDNDGDGLTNDVDPDDDNDGLSDADEALRGTNPLVADTDNDGVSDGQEIADGSNPLDRGSAVEVLGLEACAEWNGFLSMWNVMEHVNLSNTTRRVFTTIYDITGTAVRSRIFDITPGHQFDMLVHDMDGREMDSYGKICSQHDGAPGDIDGRMVYYRPDTDPNTPEEFEFALSMRLSEGRRGRQWSSVNMYQPSRYWADQANVLANWVQLTSMSTKPESGDLIYYRQDGTEIGRVRATLAPGARQDFAGHDFGTNWVGLVAWHPDDESSRFALRVIRYLYNNTIAFNGFDTAFQLEGRPGTGQQVVLPLDTSTGSSIIEFSNVHDGDTVVSLQIYREDGALLLDTAVALAAKATFHLITDDLLAGGRGVASLQSNVSGGLLAGVMQYGLRANGSITYMFGLPAREGLGAVLRGSYNTFLAQASELWLSNSVATTVQSSAQTVRFDGTVRQIPALVTPPNGGTVFLINNVEQPDAYGVVTEQPDIINSLVGWVLRRKGQEYVIPVDMN